jgi:hypothetical protein
MPRVNRDLQRRMAARRDRERRRPAAERRYRFAAPEAGLEPDDTLVADGADATEAVADLETEKTPPKRARAIKTEATQSSSRAATRAVSQPFSAYRAEYAYVLGDLRRVGLVIGSLLLILLLVYFVLPR